MLDARCLLQIQGEITKMSKLSKVYTVVIVPDTTRWENS